MPLINNYYKEIPTASVASGGVILGSVLAVVVIISSIIAIIITIFVVLVKKGMYIIIIAI